jgi:phospholipase C
MADVEHVVVVMMENPSFDHMLGYLGASPRAGFHSPAGVRPEHLRQAARRREGAP